MRNPRARPIPGGPAVRMRPTPPAASASASISPAFAELYRRGVLATLPALLVSSAYSFLWNRLWALEPITERVMLLTPVDLSQQLLLRLGTYARPLALFGGLAVCIAIGGIVSVVAGPLPPAHAGQSRARQLARPMLALTVLLLALFVVFPPLYALPTLILAGLYVAALGWPLLRPSRPLSALRSRTRPAGEAEAHRVATLPGVGPYQYERAAPPAGSAVPDPRAAALSGAGTRGAFLADSARILGATAVLTALLLVEPWYKGLTVHRHGGRLFAFRTPPPRHPGFDLAGLSPEITPPSEFYYLTKNLIDPDLSADGWTLRLDGLVARQTAVTFDDLLALPRRDQWVTQECVSNPVGGPLISTALFSGVSLRRLLLRAGPLPSATRLVMRAPDGHADSIPLSRAMEGDVLLAYGMDGAYLERAHGYPVRALIPGSYGFKSIKWVTHLELVDHSFKGTWQELGWTEAATVHTTARIDLARREGTGMLVAGVAFAGRRGIRAVQVRVEGGPWIVASLHTPPISPLTWLQWRTTLPLPSGARTLRVEARALDGSGNWQEQRQSDIYPAGATGYHGVTVRA